MDEILEILEHNARIGIDELARLVKKTPKEVEKAIKRYKNKGVILEYKTVINKNLVKSEENVVALIEVSVIPQKDVGFDHIAERIYQFSEVKSCYLISGSYDLLLVVEGKNIHTIANFIAEKLAPLNAVKNTTTHFMLKKYKEDGVIFGSKRKYKRLNITY